MAPAPESPASLALPPLSLSPPAPAGAEAVPHPRVSPAALYLARLAPGSRRAMDSALRTIARLLLPGSPPASEVAWWRLRYQHTVAIRAELSARYSTAHANKLLASLRGVLRESWRLGLMRTDDYERACDLPRVRGRTLRRGRALDASELARLMSRCQEAGNALGIRDAALIALAYGGGLRRAELVALDLSGVDLPGGALTIRRGKGRKDRRVFISPEVSRAIENWLGVRGPGPGPLFVRVLRGGHVRVSQLSAQTVYDVFRRRAAEAGIGAFSPHDVRRTTATELLRAGTDLGVVQRILGHASVTTTLRYDERGEEAEKEAAAALDLPAVPLQGPASEAAPV